jgi:hypothetical protein
VLRKFALAPLAKISGGPQALREDFGRLGFIGHG